MAVTQTVPCVQTLAASWTAGSFTLEPVTVEIGAGTLVAVIGPSGAGKTTLLELLAGVRQPVAGQVAHPAEVGYVPQDDIASADQVIVLSDGAVTYSGPPGDASYDRLTTGAVAWSPPPVVLGERAPAPPRRRVSAARQWWLLTARAVELLVRNRITLAILAGSPVMIALMFLMLFRPRLRLLPYLLSEVAALLPLLYLVAALLLASYEDSFDHPLWTHWSLLAGFSVLFAVLTLLVLRRKAGPVR